MGRPSVPVRASSGWQAHWHRPPGATAPRLLAGRRPAAVPRASFTHAPANFFAQIEHRHGIQRAAVVAGYDIEIIEPQPKRMGVLLLQPNDAHLLVLVDRLRGGESA